MKERIVIVVVSVLLAIVLVFAAFQVLYKPPPTKSEQWIATSSDLSEINWTATGTGEFDEYRLRMWLGSEHYDKVDISDAAESILIYEPALGLLEIVIYLLHFPTTADANTSYELSLSSWAVNQTSIEHFEWHLVSIGDGGFVSLNHKIGNSNYDGVLIVFAKGTAVVFMNIGWDEQYYQANGEPDYTQYAELQAAKIPQT